MVFVVFCPTIDLGMPSKKFICLNYSVHIVFHAFDPCIWSSCRRGGGSIRRGGLFKWNVPKRGGLFEGGVYSKVGVYSKKYGKHFGKSSNLLRFLKFKRSFSFFSSRARHCISVPKAWRELTSFRFMIVFILWPGVSCLVRNRLAARRSQHRRSITGTLSFYLQLVQTLHSQLKSNLILMKS